MAGSKKLHLLTWLHTDGDGVPMAEARLLRLSKPEVRKLLMFMGIVKRDGDCTSDVGLEEAKVKTYKKFLDEAREESLFDGG